MKYMLIISYDGSKFWGFQRQKKVRNVQGYLEDVLSKILDEDITIKGSGRTDRGVHALYQVVHFETNNEVRNLKREANKILEDVKIKKVKRVDAHFHARHDVKSKTYLYKIDLKGNRDKNYYGYVKNKLDINKMKKASKLFEGTHNFQNFVSGERLDYHTTIKKITIWKFNNVLYLEFTGYAFYRYMVRNLVGALVEVGKGKISTKDIQDRLDLKTDKRLPTFSPNGLYLKKIKYSD